MDELHTKVPKDLKWGVIKNSEEKNVFWFGYKGHLAAGTSSQYILQAYFSSGSLNDDSVGLCIFNKAIMKFISETNN